MKTHGVHLNCSILAGLILGSFMPIQQAKAQTAPAGGLEIASAEGTLVAATTTRIKLKSDEDKEYLALLTPKSKIKYSGTAEADFLQQGFFVRLKAEFDVQQGALLTPLTELQIFTPVQSRRMSRQQKQSQTPGIYPVDKEGKPATDVAASGTQMFQVVGRVGLVQPDKVQLFAGNRPMILELSPEIKITVTGSDTAFCQPGDAIKVTGLRNPQQKDWISAESIEIKGAKPLTTTKKQPTLRRSRQERSQPGEDK